MSLSLPVFFADTATHLYHYSSSTERNTIVSFNPELCHVKKDIRGTYLCPFMSLFTGYAPNQFRTTGMCLNTLQLFCAYSSLNLSV